MELTLASSWRALGYRGLVAVLFAVVTFAWPGLDTATLVVLFAAYALLDGLFAIAAQVGTRERAGRRWWMLSLEGGLGIAIGLAALVLRGLVTEVLLYIIAGWAIVTGCLELATARLLRDDVPDELMFVIAGVASVALGALMLSWPQAGPVVLVLLFGAYALFFGMAMCALAFKLRYLVQGKTP